MRHSDLNPAKTSLKNCYSPRQICTCAIKLKEASASQSLALGCGLTGVRHMQNTGTEYRGFLSYSHEDRVAAYRLLTRLQTYRLPSNFPKGTPNRLGRFFLDRENLAAAANLSEAILEGLQQARTLIVLCSPAASKSRWVELEIENFRKLRPDGDILAVIVSGDPEERSGQSSCFPKALLKGGEEPLAADFRKTADGPKLGFLKLVAALSGIELQALLRRDQTRQRRRVTAVTTASMLIALTMSLLAVAAASARQQAETRRAEAEGLVDFMLGDLRDRLEPLGRLDVLDGVARETLEYYDEIPEQDLDCAQIVRKAKALQLSADLISHDDPLPTDEFQAVTKLAYTLTSQNLEECSQTSDYLLTSAHSAFWYAYAAREADNTKVAGAQFSNYLALAQLLHAASPNNSNKREVAAARMNLGIFNADQGLMDEAATLMKEAADALYEIVLTDGQDEEAAQYYVDSFGWRSRFLIEQNRLEEAIELREIEVAEANHILVQFPSSWKVSYILASAERNLARLHFLNEEFGNSFEVSQRSVDRFRQLTAHDPNNGEWQRGLAFASVLHFHACQTGLVSNSCAPIHSDLETGEGGPPFEFTEQEIVEALEIYQKGETHGE